MSNSFDYGVSKLDIDTAFKLMSGQVQGCLTEVVKTKLKTCQGHIQDIIDAKKIVYSINTGFGALCKTIISPEDTKKLQDNILRSHSVGVGDPMPQELAKLMLILKVHSLCFGYSGSAVSTIERILWHVENDIIPVVPCQGSVGASGDLAPLAHLFLPLIGLGEVFHKGQIVKTEKIFQEYKLSPLDLGAKEGLALINGTQFIASYAVKVAERLRNCLDVADIIGALSLEAMLGSVQPFKSKLHDLRPHPGAQLVARRLTCLLKGSEVLNSHKDCDRVQDPYSLRCMPQVHGASRDAWSHLNTQLKTELNAVTDNPIIFSAEETISGGNFHGQPLALPLDYACLAASELGSISERRTYLLVEGKAGLPLLLMKDTGINSGFMIPQYTAAALVSECKTDCFPASADSIPTSIGQEDHVSMGSISGRKALRVVKNLENVLAIELLCAAQAFDFRRPLKSSKILEACHDLIRSQISHASDDRVFSDDVRVAHQMITDGRLVQTANEAAQNLGIDLGGVAF